MIISVDDKVIRDLMNLDYMQSLKIRVCGIELIVVRPSTYDAIIKSAGMVLGEPGKNLTDGQGC